LEVQLLPFSLIIHPQPMTFPGIIILHPPIFFIFPLPILFP
jgi:hypothetical protein